MSHLAGPAKRNLWPAGSHPTQGPSRFWPLDRGAGEGGGGGGRGGAEPGRRAAGRGVGWCLCPRKVTSLAPDSSFATPQSYYYYHHHHHHHQSSRNCKTRAGFFLAVFGKNTPPPSSPHPPKTAFSKGWRANGTSHYLRLDTRG